MVKDRPRGSDEAATPVDKSIDEMFRSLEAAPMVGLQGDDAYRERVRGSIEKLLGEATVHSAEEVSAFASSIESGSSKLSDDHPYPYRCGISRRVTSHVVIDPASELSESSCRRILRQAVGVESKYGGIPLDPEHPKGNERKDERALGGALLPDLQKVIRETKTFPPPPGSRHRLERAGIAARAMIAEGLIREKDLTRRLVDPRLKYSALRNEPPFQAG